MKIIKKRSSPANKTPLHSRLKFCKLPCAHETEVNRPHFNFYRRRNLFLRLNIKEGQTTTARHKVFQDALLLDQSNNFILSIHRRRQLTKKHRQSRVLHKLSWIYSHSIQSYLGYIKGTVV